MLQTTVGNDVSVFSEENNGVVLGTNDYNVFLTYINATEIVVWVWVCVIEWETYRK